jgi:hypothetical protein
MDGGWASEFQERMRAFETMHPRNGPSVSLKIRVTSGCFHREHSPRAYALIDEQLAKTRRDESPFEFIEHENGPEILAFVTAGLSLATSVTNLVIAILAARRQGVSEGDQPSDPLELIVRRTQSGGTLQEEMVLRIDHRDDVDRARNEALLDAAVERLADETAEKD